MTLAIPNTSRRFRWLVARGVAVLILLSSAVWTVAQLAVKPNPLSSGPAFSNPDQAAAHALDTLGNARKGALRKSIRQLATLILILNSMIFPEARINLVSNTSSGVVSASALKSSPWLTCFWVCFFCGERFVLLSERP